jgi:hypothetical protein
MSAELITAYTAGDTAPPLTRTPPDSIANLSGYTIRLRLRRADGIVITKTITEAGGADGQITSADPPQFAFMFAAADLIEGPTQEAEIEYDDGAGGIQTEGPILFSINPAIG